MEIIVAVDENYGIGKDGDLLAHLSPDLKRLKAMTVGNIIVMGSKTSSRQGEPYNHAPPGKLSRNQVLYRCG